MGTLQRPRPPTQGAGGRYQKHLLATAPARIALVGNRVGRSHSTACVEKLRSPPVFRQRHSGSVIGMSSHISCRKVPMKNDMNDIKKIADGKT